MVWLGVYFKGVTPSVILDEGAVDHTIYIKKSVPRCIEIWESSFR